MSAPDFVTVAEIRTANRRIGHYWFTEGAMKFFGTRLDPDGTVYGGRWFLASHQPPHGPRFWAIHRAGVDGSVDTVGLELLHLDGQTDKAVSETIARWFERFDPVDAVQDAAATVAARAVNEPAADVDAIVSETTGRRNPYGPGTVQDLALEQMADRDHDPTIGEWLVWHHRLADIGRMARDVWEASE